MGRKNRAQKSGTHPADFSANDMYYTFAPGYLVVFHIPPKETLMKSSAADNGSFDPTLQFGKLEIHTVFLRYPNLDLCQNLSLTVLVDFIIVSSAVSPLLGVSKTPHTKVL